MMMMTCHRNSLRQHACLLVLAPVKHLIFDPWELFISKLSCRINYTAALFFSLDIAHIELIAGLFAMFALKLPFIVYMNTCALMRLVHVRDRCRSCVAHRCRLASSEIEMRLHQSDFEIPAAVCKQSFPSSTVICFVGLRTQGPYQAQSPSSRFIRHGVAAVRIIGSAVGGWLLYRGRLPKIFSHEAVVEVFLSALPSRSTPDQPARPGPPHP